MSIFCTGSKGFLGPSVCALFPDITQDLKGQDFAYQRNIVGTVIHLACPSNISESIKNPSKYIENSLDIIRLIRNNRIYRMVYLSNGTTSVYGNKHQAKEEDASFNTCTNPYGIAKLIAEKIIKQMVPSYCILRLANVVGVNAVGVISNIHKHLQEDNPIKVFGDKPMREFAHIHDVMGAIARAVVGEVEGTYNIGSGVETNIRSLAEWYGAERGVPVEVVPSRVGDPDYHSTLDCSKAIAAGLLTHHKNQ